MQYTLDQMRVSQQSPYGSQTWNKTPGQLNTQAYQEALAKYDALPEKIKRTTARPTEDYYRDAPQWTYNQTLSPEQQQLYDADVSSKLQQSELLGGAADRVAGAMGQPVSTSGLPSRGGAISAPQAPGTMGFGQQAPTYNPGSVQGPQATRLGQGQIASTGAVGSAGSGFDAGRQNSVAESLYNQQMRFAQPEMERADERLRGQLIQSGFQEGSEGYANERNRLMQQQEMFKADARDRAILASGQEDSRRFGQDMASSQFGVGLAQARDATEAQRAQQNFGQGMDVAQFGREGGQQNFMNQMAGLGFDRDTAAQLWQQGLASGQLGFQQQMQAGGYNQSLRDNALREQMMLRQLPLNELNALRTGAQVNLPNNPAQYGSPQLASQDYIGAADKTYGAQMNAYNAQQQSQNALLGGLFGLGGAMLGTPAAGKALFGG